MSVQKPRDLAALMKAWPALGADGTAMDDTPEPSWDARADAIARAAIEAGPGDPKALAALLDEPLPQEAGEDAAPPKDDGAAGALPPRSLRLVPGERTMSSGSGDEKDGPAPSRKRTSLKEMAERASQSSGRGSMPSAPGIGRASTPPPAGVKSAPPAPLRATGGASSDSGIVDLNAINNAATPEQIAAAEKAKPASESLFEEDSAAPAAGAAKPAVAKAAAKKPAAAPPAKSNSGMIAGVVIALVGIAAAVAIVQVRSNKPQAVAQADAPKHAQHDEAAPAGQPAPQATAPAAASAKEAAAAPTSTALDPDHLPEGDEAATAHRAAGRAGPSPAKEPAEAKTAAPPAAVAGRTGTLTEEMEKAVGADRRKKAVESEAEEPSPASGHDQTVPEAPSQGAVQSAIGSVLGNAKACVADADEATRAVVTFGSSGSVSSVTVSGWAAMNGKSSCVTRALKAAKVGAFAKPTFSVPVTVRP